MSLSSGRTQSLCVWPSGRTRVEPAQTFHPPAGDVDSDCKSLENMPGAMATYLQRSTGSSSSSHSRPGGHTGSKLYAHVCCTRLPSPGRGWGAVQVKPRHPCPPQGSSETCYWDEHILGEFIKIYPSTTVSIQATKPGILELPSKRQKSVPAQLSLGSSLPTHFQHVPEAFWKPLGGLGR